MGAGMNDTVRKFPRTLQEAFPSDRRHAYAVEVHRRPLMTVGDVLMAILLGLLLVALLLHALDALFI